MVNAKLGLLQQIQIMHVNLVRVFINILKIKLFFLILDPYDCELQKTCTECQTIGPRCGWCDDGSGTGLGRCMAGTSSGPLEVNSCSVNQWYFTGEPG